VPLIGTIPESGFYSQLDKPADCSNRELFEHQAALLPKNAVWYASNLSRAIDTAKALTAAGATMGKLEIEPALAEQSFGDWHGLTYEELGRLHGENHHFWLVPPLKRAPGGESFADLYDRTVDAVARMIPEVLGSSDAHNEESIYSGLLEYPQYTKPRQYEGMDVPEVLISGNHRLIHLWQFEKSLELTKERRPDLWEAFLKKESMLTKDEKKILKKIIDQNIE
jgi:hypothetical protein